MPTSIASIDNFGLTNAAQVAYTTPANTIAVVQKLTATSEEATANRLLTIYKVAPAGAPGATNTIVYQMSVPPGPITDIPQMVNQVLEPGYTLQAKIDSGTIVFLNGSLIQVT